MTMLEAGRLVERPGRRPTAPYDRGARVLAATLALAIAQGGGCRHAPTHEKVRSYDAQLSPRLGRAKMPEILALLGEPEVRDRIGESESWIYQFEDNGEPARGRPELRTVAPDRDEILLNFDREGTLQSYHVVIEGRTTKRGRR